MLGQFWTKAAAAAVAVLLALAPAKDASAQTIGANESLSASSGSSANVQLTASVATYPALMIVPAFGTSVEVFYALGTSNSAAATTSSPALPPGGICFNSVGPNTYVAAITGSGSATLRLTQMATCPPIFANGGGGGGGSGTVTSVALALPSSVFTISGSPVTTTGTLTGTFASQTANTVFAGPTTGVAATPAFRSLVAADIPISFSGSAGQVGVFSSGTALNGYAGLTYSDTSNVGLQVVSHSFGLSGNISAAAWTTNGVRYKNVAATLTDTTSSGTVAAAYTDVWGGNTIAASSATTYTNYSTMFLSVPVQGTNVTFTNKWSLLTGGGVSIAGGLAAGAQTVLLVNPASASGLLADFQVGGASKFNIGTSITTVTSLIPSYALSPTTPSLQIVNPLYTAAKLILLADADTTQHGAVNGYIRAGDSSLDFFKGLYTNTILGLDVSEDPTHAQSIIELGQYQQNYWLTTPNAGYPGTISGISNGTPAVVTATGHNLLNNNALYFTTTGTLPSPLAPNTVYYVTPSSQLANTFNISATPNGAAINTTTNGSGTITMIPAANEIRWLNVRYDITSGPANYIQGTFNMRSCFAALTSCDSYSYSLNSDSLGVNGQAFFIANGALSKPGINAYGSWITGGTATTTKPYVLIEPAVGTASTGWNTAGTGLGVNAPSGFTGNIVDFQINGTSLFKINPTGNLTTITGNLSASVTIQAAAGITATSTTTGQFLSNSQGHPSYLLSSTGANYGQIVNVGADTWAIGYGSSATTNGTAVITWTDNGTVTIAPNNSITTITGSLTVSALANVATTSAVCYNTGTGVLTYDGTIGTCTISGRQFKNILGGLGTVGNVGSLRPAVYRYKPESGFDDGRVHVGLIAQDVARMDDRCAVRNAAGEIINYEDRCVLAHLVADNDNLRAEVETIKRSIAR